MPKLSRRTRLILIHLMDSAILAVVAGFVVALLCAFLSKVNEPIVGRLAELRYLWSAVFIVLVLMGLGALGPRHMIAIVRGFFRFPAHCGLIIKTLLGFIVALLVLWLLLGAGNVRLLLYGLCVAAPMAVGLAVGYWVARRLEGGRGTASTCSGEANAPHDAAHGTARWRADDQPIQNSQENRLAEHLHVAIRILGRLLPPGPPQGLLPNIAIMGPYGSGKTSICNLVKDRYRQRRRDGESLPQLLFITYEGWPYVTAAAATRGLVEEATKAILEVADVAPLWRLPDQYASVIKETGGTLTLVATSFLDGPGDPESVLGVIGESLERLGLRVVVFVDDLDRVEKDSLDTYRAVVQALNQLQRLQNFQYVIAIGPTGDHPGLDLLKLTRHQELVPSLDPEWIIKEVRSLRDEALEDTTDYFPWAEVQAGEKDPLTWHDWFGFISPGDLLTALIELLDTPRALKSALRETAAAWCHGLKGEIDWYDLLLTSALRVAEPALFEWIARDRGLFIHGPDVGDFLDNEQKQQERAGELKKKLFECLQRPGDMRQKVILSLMKRLFPAFGFRVAGESGSFEAAPWRQGIGYCLANRRSYLERFLSGVLVEGELRDQPTLQFIRQIMQGKLDEGKFESMYLDSLEKLTGPLNKLVQFSGLLSLEKRLQVCDVILAWVSDPAHAREWPNPPEDYYRQMMGDVYHIIGRSDVPTQRRMQVEDSETPEQTVFLWLYAKVDQHAATGWHMLEALLGIVTHQGSGPWSVRTDVAKGLWQQLAEQLRKVYFVGDRPLIDAVGEDRFAIYRFIVALQQHKDYDSVRPAFTTKFIQQAVADGTHRLKGSVILSLTPAQYPVTDGECPVEAYTFTVDKQRNEQLFDMSVVVPAIQSWADLTLPDPVAQRAFEVLKEAYGIVK